MLPTMHHEEINRELIEELLANGKYPAVTVIVEQPFARPEIRQNTARAKNALAAAYAELEAVKCPLKEAKEILKPLTRYIESGEQRRPARGSLAFFLASDYERMIRLPNDEPQHVIVSDRFELNALIRQAIYNRDYYIVSLSLHKAAFAKANAFRFDLHEIESLQGGMEKVLNLDLRPEITQRTLFGGGQAGATPVFRGSAQPDSALDLKRHLVDYLRIVDREVRQRATDGKLPMVLSGVDYLVSLYKDICSHPKVFDRFVETGMDEIAAEELHRRSWEICYAQVKIEEQELFARIENQRGGPRFNTDLEAILRAAESGLADTVVIRPTDQVWGRLSSELAVEVHRERKPGDINLLDVVASSTFSRGGKVIYTEQQIGKPCQAVLRSPISSETLKT